MLAEFDVSSSRKRVPYYAFVRPEHGDKAVDSFVITECGQAD